MENIKNIKDMSGNLKKNKERLTRTQQNALHLWFELMAQALNDGGFNVQLVLKQKMDIDWNKELIKELLWRPAQKVILHKESSTELLKQGDIDKIFDHLNRHLGEKFWIHVPFPSEQMINSVKINEKN